MTAAHPTCREIEPDLVAHAAGEAEPAARALVEAHVARCAPCRDDLGRYRAVEGLVKDWRERSTAEADPTLARAQLESRLADLRSRTVSFGLFSSPLGLILVARSELGVSMIEYVDSAADAAARVSRRTGEDAAEEPAQVAALRRELEDYLEGRRTRLDWPLDLRGARSDFQRRVLEATARLPYGAVTSYGHIARDIGAPEATRAVAQALRRNPLPIAIPCHRVVGSGGGLTGYAGRKVGLKRQLLALEGVPVVARGEGRVKRAAMYVRYQAGEEYCVPSCGGIGRMPLTELTLFGSRERAERAGLAPCASCRPDLHPLSE